MGYKGKYHLNMDDDWGYPYFRKASYLKISSDLTVDMQSKYDICISDGVCHPFYLISHDISLTRGRVLSFGTRRVLPDQLFFFAFHSISLFTN